MIKLSKTPQNNQNRREKHTFISNYLFYSFYALQSILINSGELFRDNTI